MGALTHNGEVLQRLPANASQINFDNTGTNLNSTQTENAIKEVNTKVNTNTSDITQLKSGLIGVGHIRTETVTLTGGEPGTDGSFTIANFGDTSPSIIQIMEVGGSRALMPTNWWVSNGTLNVQYTIVSSTAYIGGGVYVHMIIA